MLALAAACGKTVFQNERFACATAGECADGYECVGGECRAASGTGGGGGGAMGGGGGGATGGGGGTGGGAMGGGTGGGTSVGLPAGSACTNTPACASGLTCVDGVCCTTACGGFCDSCNQPGFEGTCRPRPAGSVAPLCNGYACDGVQTACATTCSLDAGFSACNPTFVCIEPACARCWSGVASDFSMNNDPAWTMVGQANIGAGKLAVSVTSNPNQARRSSATHVERLPFAGCGVSFELVTPPPAPAGYAAELNLANADGGRPSFGWRFSDGGLLAAWSLSDGGVGELPVGAARWLRVEESNGEVRWRTAAGATFTTVHAVTHGETLGPMRLELNGAFPAQPATTAQYEIDNLNLGP